MVPDAPSRLQLLATETTLLATSVAWPLIAAGVALVTALALWGLFRRGSIADRAREDDDLGEKPGADGPR